MTTMACQITSLMVVYSTVYSDADQSKHQSSASLTFVWGIHRDRWIPRTKGQLRGKCFHLMTSSCNCCNRQTCVTRYLIVWGHYHSSAHMVFVTDKSRMKCHMGVIPCCYRIVKKQLWALWELTYIRCLASVLYTTAANPQDNQERLFILLQNVDGIWFCMSTAEKY